jgi:hypothetical protein
MAILWEAKPKLLLKSRNTNPLFRFEAAWSLYYLVWNFRFIFRWYQFFRKLLQRWGSHLCTLLLVDNFDDWLRSLNWWCDHFGRLRNWVIIRSPPFCFFSRCILSLRWIGLWWIKVFLRRFKGLKIIIIFIVVFIVINFVINWSKGSLLCNFSRRTLIFLGSFLNLLHVRCIFAACLDGFLLGKWN